MDLKVLVLNVLYKYKEMCGMIANDTTIQRITNEVDVKNL